VRSDKGDTLDARAATEPPGRAPLQLRSNNRLANDMKPLHSG